MTNVFTPMPRHGRTPAGSIGNSNGQRNTFLGYKTLMLLRRTACTLALLGLPLLAQNASKGPELVGTVSFDIGSNQGRVETMEITIGDGGTGPYKAVLTGDPSLPTHAIWRPKNLAPFGKTNLLPIVAMGNGGCRNSSGELRNILSDIASHGFVVVSIGPAGNAVIMGSEERTNTTASSQLLDGVAWAIAENTRQGSPFFGKIDVTKVAVAGQSCGAEQAVDVSLDPRVTTTIMLNQGVNMTQRRPPEAAAAANPGAQTTPAGAPPAAPAKPRGAERRDLRYAPHAPLMVRSPDSPPPSFDRSARIDILGKLHGPIFFLNGGPKDSGFAPAKSNFEFINHVPAVFAHQDVGHFPATYRQPNGGAFSKAFTAWVKWQLKGDESAKKMFVGEKCGLCTDPTWTIERKNVQ